MSPSGELSRLPGAYNSGSKMKKIKFQKRGDRTFALLSDLKVAEWYQKQLIVGKADFLKQSLQKKGFLRPIVINMYPGREGIIIDGVQIMLSCIDLGIEEVPVFEVNVDAQNERESHVLLNNAKSENDRQKELFLMRDKYYQYFAVDHEILDAKITPYDNLVTEFIEDELDREQRKRPCGL
jgi:hypothetical protein